MEKRTWQTVYWLIAGMILGFSSIALDLWPVIWPATVFGLVMVLAGAVWLRKHGMWALLVGFGVLPALLLTGDIVTSFPQCSPGGGMTVPDGQQYGRCSGPLPDLYYVLAAAYTGIVVIGIVWAVIQHHREQK